MLTVKKVYDSASGTLEIPSEVLPENGLPFSHHFTSTPGDNLIELAGKICYDSCQNPKSRDSKSYHQHINEVGHWSTHGHLNITIELPINKHTDELFEYLTCFINKPGFHIVLTNKDDYTQNMRITGNLRAIREWFTFNTEIPKESGKFDYLGYCLQSWARLIAPEAIKGVTGSNQLYKYAGSLITPEDANEIWASFYIGGVSRGLCYDSETEVLTTNGWKFFKDVNIDTDLFATLNTNNHNLEYQKAICKTDENWSGEMYKIKSTMVDLLVTPNHRMYIQPINTQKYRRKEQQFIIKQAKELVGKRVNYKKNANWIGLNPKYITIDSFNRKHGNGTTKINEQKYLTEDFVEFLGYFISEGYTHHSKGSSYTINICQNEGAKLNKIINCVKRLNLSYSIKNNVTDSGRKIQIYNQSLFNYLNKHCGKGAFNKKIPDQIKTFGSNLINILLDAIILGDGNIHKTNGHRVIYTSSKILSDDLQELILKTGLSASIRIDNRVGKERFGKWSHIKQTQPNYIVSIANQNSQHPTVNAAKKQDELIEYHGRVYCVTVPNGTLYVRRNGIPVWSGNTHELCRHGHQTGISQRSSRYCDESESEWAWHPLVQKYQDKIDKFISATYHPQIGIEATSKESYEKLVKLIEEEMIKEGSDKATARKQSRGCARGVLGNALSTELIFSASLAQWKRIILMRSRDEADAEIRLMTNKIFHILKEKWPAHFYNLTSRPAKDGIGEHVEQL